MSKNIKNTIIKIVNSQLSDNMKSDHIENVYLDELDLDSLDRLEIIMSLEETFDIHIKDKEAGSWKTVKDIIEYIERKVS